MSVNGRKHDPNKTRSNPETWDWSSMTHSRMPSSAGQVLSTQTSYTDHGDLNPNMAASFRNVLKTSALVISLGLVACTSTPKPTVLMGYGPKDIHAGKPFNVQPSGKSAIWTDTKDAPKTAVPVLAGQILPGADVNPSGTVVSGLVPKELYEKPGTYPLYIVDTKTGKKSNEIMFTVKK